jgi:hypothetical protein
MSDNTNNFFRIGLFTYLLPDVVSLTNDISSGNANGANVQGYVTTMNFSSTFRSGALNTPPFEIDVRTNLPDANLMGSSADYTALGTGGSSDGAAGFQNGTTYTNVFSVTRSSGGSVGITNTATGPAGFKVSFGMTDTTGTNVVDFNTFAMRAANANSTCTSIDITLFQVELSTSASLSPIPLYITRSGTNAVLSWANPAFYLQSASVVQGPYTTIGGAGSPYTNGLGGSQKFYRLNSIP